MSQELDGIDDKLAEWLQGQHVFFVASAPLAGDGLVNCSPKGLAGTFAVVDPHTVAYLDLTGSGIETIAHLRENGRIVLMFCAFDGRPNIVRLHGRGRVILPADPGFAGLVGRFTEHPGVRSVIVVDVERLSESCGYAVPTMEYRAERDVLDLSNGKRGEDGLAEYRREKNARSLDGLPGLA
ncbi:MAG: pyridoxamine 5'-phosphate oxidase family protein [Actinomycetota bacterium]|nr:pyridoxamine 5'-phosphate oxidase family protein [Actinomycetota bacterium]